MPQMLIDAVGESSTWRRAPCARCAHLERDLANSHREIGRAIKERNAMVMHAHAVASRLEALKDWRRLADQMDEDIPSAHRTTWSRLVQSLEAATE
jgi:hypothetical protein